MALWDEEEKRMRGRMEERKIVHHRTRCVVKVKVIRLVFVEIEVRGKRGLGFCRGEGRVLAL